MPTPNARTEAGSNQDCLVLNARLSRHQTRGGTDWRTQFEFLGVLFGLAIRSGAPVSVPLAPPIWKLLVGQPVASMTSTRSTRTSCRRSRRSARWTRALSRSRSSRSRVLTRSAATSASRPAKRALRPPTGSFTRCASPLSSASTSSTPSRSGCEREWRALCRCLCFRSSCLPNLKPYLNYSELELVHNQFL